MPSLTNGINQYGCTVYTLNGFPSDTNTRDWLDAELAKLEAALAPCGQYSACRALILSLNRGQLEAKAALEKHGFQVIAITLSAHHPKEKMQEWIEAGCPEQGWEVIYLMGRGFYNFNSLNMPPQQKPKAWGWRK